MHTGRVAAAVLAVVCLARIALAEETPLPASVMADGAKTADCTEEMNADSVVGTSDLGGGQALVEVRCWIAAYQSGSIFFLVRKGAADGARLLRFQVADKQGFATTISLSDADFDEKTRIMRSFYKGRGAGDCGAIGEWKWTGSDFKLVRYLSKPDCDGKPFDDDDEWQVFPKR
jgi:hypothetical protein